MPPLQVSHAGQSAFDWQAAPQYPVVVPGSMLHTAGAVHGAESVQGVAPVGKLASTIAGDASSTDPPSLGRVQGGSPGGAQRQFPGEGQHMANSGGHVLPPEELLLDGPDPSGRATPLLLGAPLEPLALPDPLLDVPPLPLPLLLAEPAAPLLPLLDAEDAEEKEVASSWAPASLAEPGAPNAGPPVFPPQPGAMATAATHTIPRIVPLASEPRTANLSMTPP